MPVIRLDDDVWQWLQSLAKPFEDTPNSVLRRLAGLDGAGRARRRPGAAEVKTQEPARADDLVARRHFVKRLTGEQLNRRYGLGARHALYHKDGTFYERLRRFPGVLCDSRGFVHYENAQQFRQDPRLSIGDKVNIPKSLASHPRYQRFPEAAR